MEAADVIIEVLDARDPLATRCTDVERYVRKSGAAKKLILLLNKIGRPLTPAVPLSCPGISLHLHYKRCASGNTYIHQHMQCIGGIAMPDVMALLHA